MKETLQWSGRERRFFLFLDYDGTLVPIRETPGQAIFPASKRRLLRRLAERVFVGVVSGRSLADIQRLIDIRDIAYLGNHGLEISSGKRCWVHPEAKRAAPTLRGVLRNIRRTTRDFPGVLVESKRITGAVHYRLADPVLWRPLKRIVQKEIERHGRMLKMTEGKRVFEIRPNVAWDKGKGVLELMDWVHPEERSRLIYIGDDQTDEDAFREINRSDRTALTIHVGRVKDTQARHRIATVPQVWVFLHDLPFLSTGASRGKTWLSAASSSKAPGSSPRTSIIENRQKEHGAKPFHSPCGRSPEVTLRKPCAGD